MTESDTASREGGVFLFRMSGVATSTSQSYRAGERHTLVLLLSASLPGADQEDAPFIAMTEYGWTDLELKASCRVEDQFELQIALGDDLELSKLFDQVISEGSLLLVYAKQAPRPRSTSRVIPFPNPPRHQPHA